VASEKKAQGLQGSSARFQHVFNRIKYTSASKTFSGPLKNTA